MNNALIIGSSGLVGSYLYKHILAEYDTTGTFKNHPLLDKNFKGIET